MNNGVTTALIVGGVGLGALALLRTRDQGEEPFSMDALAALLASTVGKTPASPKPGAGNNGVVTTVQNNQGETVPVYQTGTVLDASKPDLKVIYSAPAGTIQSSLPAQVVADFLAQFK